MNLVILQQTDIFDQYFSGLQFPTVAMIAIAIFFIYKFGKMQGWF